jgi:hypothetical protein
MNSGRNKSLSGSIPYGAECRSPLRSNQAPLTLLAVLLLLPAYAACSSKDSTTPGSGVPVGGVSGTAAGGAGGDVASGGSVGVAGAGSAGAENTAAGSGGAAAPAGGAANVGGAGTDGVGGAAAGSGGLPPDFGMGESNEGPGGPSKTFTADQLYKHCAGLDGGAGDKAQQHDIVSMYDGYLVLPWSPEQGTGGISFYDVSDACAPKTIGYGYSDEMRETHSVAISNIAGGHWEVVDMIRVGDFMGGMGVKTTTGARAGGVQIWDISDVKNPKAVSTLDVPGHDYPDAYKRVVLAEWWQGKYIYAGGGLNGVFVVDASNPLKPTLAKQISITPAMPVFGVMAIGNLLAIASSEQSRVVLMDISDPINPKPIPGGDFNLKSAKGVNTNSYMFNIIGGFAYFGRQSGTGGFIMYDLHDPTSPKLVTDYPDGTGNGANGAYVFRKDQFVFAGNSDNGGIYDVSDTANVKLVAHTMMQGDNDWVTPIGNVVFTAVDENAIKGQATVVQPWQQQPDTIPPKATWSYPADGATNIRTTSRIGVSFSEAIDIKSGWKAGYVMLYETALGQASRVEALINVEDTIVNLSPTAPLKPNTSYTLEIPAGGLEDFNANKLQTGFKMTVTTGAQ